MAIRPTVDDYYRDLGVARDASPEELSAAFRRRAKELHPDAGAAQPGAGNPGEGDPDATEEFKRVSRAYSVLRDPVRRARYDAHAERPAEVGDVVSRDARPAPSTTAPVAARPVVARPRAWHLTRRTARRMVGAGIVLVVLGVVAGVWVMTVQRRDAELRARGVAVVATVVEVDGHRGLRFTTRSGDVVVASEATKTGTEAPELGSAVRIHYDRDQPTRVVADGSHTARDITLWIVAVKFVVGGVVLACLGARRLRR